MTRAALALAAAVTLAACVGTGGDEPASGADAEDASADSPFADTSADAPFADAATEASADSPLSDTAAEASADSPFADTAADGSDAAASCLAAPLLASLGKSRVLVGASMEDSVATQGPFDLRYMYLAGLVPDGSGPCASCASGCSAGGDSCDNSAGCGWWGCWQWDQDPPGAYVRDFLDRTAADGQIPMITYYLLLQASGVAEGLPEVDAANDAAFLSRWFADYRFFLQQVGNRVALVHVEPDFWGYARMAGADPHQLPAAVPAANPADCAGQEASIAGLGRCIVAMARKYAPNAKVGLHASSWSTYVDAFLNTDASVDVVAEARDLGGFLREAGAAEGDFLAVDPSDRDAAWYATQGVDTWWDATNQKLPDFQQAFAWSAAVAESAGLPILWWQIPVGNMSLPDAPQAWRDNRVDYLFDHVPDLAASHAFGMAFGAGEAQQTNPSTDGGHLVARADAYAAAGGVLACH